MMRRPYVNAGCGSNYHPDWINLDIAPVAPEVQWHDLSRGLPLPDASCEAVYHSHLLEHLRRAEALPFVRECHRVLKHGGILRVVVPDLEQICRQYLECLGAARNGRVTYAPDYEWMMLELYDQTVREQSGGGMLQYLSQDPLPNEAFVYQRVGEEGRAMVRILRQRSEQSASTTARARHGFPSLRTLPWRVRRLADWLVTHALLSPSGVRAYEMGRFRLTGEVHQWMYDEYSLTCLMETTGFRDAMRHSAMSSRIPGWREFHLDALQDGTVRKPDSLFMEFVKP